MKMKKSGRLTNRDYRKLALLIAYITAIFIFAEFLHTDTHFNPLDDCPICQWERSFYTPGQLEQMLILLLFVLLFKLFPGQESRRQLHVARYYQSRAPPIH